MAKRGAKTAAVDPLDKIRDRFIEHGSDPAIAKKAMEDATGLSRGLWLSFLTFGTYLVITFAGVDHRDLLLENPIELPVLKAPLPLVTFFWVAPILFVIFHLYLLLSLKLLADQVHHYTEQLRDSGLDEDAQDKARLQLPNFVIVQVLGGTSTQVNSWSGKLMTFTAFLTLVASPLILLLFAQLMFLPYHGWWVTMSHRVMVVIDLVFIWYFWEAIRRGSGDGLPIWSVAASGALMVLTFLVLRYPSERFYGNLAKSIFVEAGAPVSQLYGASPVEVGFALFNNTLVLPGERFVDNDTFEALEKQNLSQKFSSAEGERSFKFLKNRDFSHADFRDIDLRKANFSGSVFTTAWLDGSSLQGATFDDASMQGASLGNASLQGASFKNAELQGAFFSSSFLQTASFLNASLQGADFSSAHLQGAIFESASLQAATFHGANAIVAVFSNTVMEGTFLSEAQLQGAMFGGGGFFGAANVDGVMLDNSNMWRATGDVSNWLASVKDTKFTSGNSRIHDDSAIWDAAEYGEVYKEALLGVPPSNVQQLKVSLEGLDPDKMGIEDSFNWPFLMNKMSTITDFDTNVFRRFTEHLTAAVCSTEGQPHVANGLSRRTDIFFMDDPPKDEMIRGLRIILGDCAGTQGMNEEVRVRLDELLDQAENRPWEIWPTQDDR